MEFYKKYRHVGYSYPNVPPSWVPAVEETIVRIERIIWPRWLPLFIKRFIHYMATGNSVVRVKSLFWYNIERKLTNGMIINDIKDKYASIRIYGQFNDEIYYLINKLEERLSHMCENCGHEGPDVCTTDTGWLRGLCDRCKGNYNIKTN